jgi:hypothetical protein
VTPEQWQWALFFLLGFFGQSLNMGVYLAIGKTGVRRIAVGLQPSFAACPSPAPNLRTLRRLSPRQVYYGTKLGHKVPWVRHCRSRRLDRTTTILTLATDSWPLQCNGFPYSLGLRHPQYVGSALSVWAMTALLYEQSRPTLVPIAICWSLLVRPAPALRGVFAYIAPI